MKFKTLLGIGLISASAQFADPMISNSQEICQKGYQLVMSGDSKGVSEKCVRIAELAERDPEWYREDGELMYSKVYYKLEKAPVPKLGVNYSYGAANMIVNSWTETELNIAVAELNGVPNSKRDTIKGMLKYWPLIKFHADQIGKKSNRILDPRDVAHIMLAEDAGYASMHPKNPSRGAAGEGSLMQIIPSTAKFMYKLHSKSYKYYEKGKPHHLGINGLINGMFFALDGKSAFGIQKRYYEEISPELKARLYDFYNKANTKERVVPTWQIENFAECSKYMFVYDFLEKKTAVQLEKIQLASKKRAETKVVALVSVKKSAEPRKKTKPKVKTAPRQDAKLAVKIIASAKPQEKKADVKSESIIKKPVSRPVQIAGFSKSGDSEVKKAGVPVNDKNELVQMKAEIEELSAKILKLKSQIR